MINSNYECPEHDFINDPRFDTCVMCHYLFKKWQNDHPELWGGKFEDDNECHCKICSMWKHPIGRETDE